MTIATVKTLFLLLENIAKKVIFVRTLLGVQAFTLYCLVPTIFFSNSHSRYERLLLLYVLLHVILLLVVCFIRLISIRLFFHYAI